MQKYYPNIDSVGLRFCGYADELVRLDHKGWYTDHYQDGILRGVVFQLSSRKGVNCFICGYENSDCGEITLSLELFNDREEAARNADRTAEIDSEKEREFNVKADAEQQIENSLDQLSELRITVGKCIIDIRNGALTACEYLKVLLETKRELWKKIELLRNNSWSVIY